MRPLVGIGIAAAAFASICSAQPSMEAIVTEMNDNLVGEYIECAAYFTIAHIAMKKSGNNAEANLYTKFAEDAAMIAHKLATKTQLEPMATQTTLARYEASYKDMLDTIANDFSKLMSSHADRCDEAMTEPTKTLKRHLEKNTAKSHDRSPIQR